MNPPGCLCADQRAAALTLASTASGGGALRTPRALSFIIALLLLLPSNGLYGAEHGFSKERGELHCWITGDIVPSDITAFRMNRFTGCDRVVLNSSGGSIDTAMTLGRMIRKAEMRVQVWIHGECASACVFLYAAGVYRSPWAFVKIHRPYLETSDLSFEETQQAFTALQERVKTYLREMNVNETLYDRMMTIPPEESVTLTLQEMEAYNLGSEDHVFVEYAENKQAARVGLSKQQWLAKKKQAKATCGDIHTQTDIEELKLRIECWKRVFPENFR